MFQIINDETIVGSVSDKSQRRLDRRRSNEITILRNSFSECTHNEATDELGSHELVGRERLGKLVTRFFLVVLEDRSFEGSGIIEKRPIDTCGSEVGLDDGDIEIVLALEASGIGETLKSEFRGAIVSEATSRDQTSDGSDVDDARASRSTTSDATLAVELEERILCVEEETSEFDSSEEVDVHDLANILGSGLRRSARSSGDASVVNKRINLNALLAKFTHELVKLLVVRDVDFL